jgi:hypothetical protein
MAGGSNRVNVVLGAGHAEKLRRLAERTHTSPGTLARSLLASALDDADPDPENVAALLDRIPGAMERARRGLDEARSGSGIRPEDI